MIAPPGWVQTEFGVGLTGDPALPDLLGLALRRNPRRAHLLVSTVLGKHIPADPRVVHGRGLELGHLVGRLLAGRSAAVLGFAETATGLGHCVAEALGADYLHSTRRLVAGVRELAGFEEEHSHATTHRLLPDDADWLHGGEVLVLVDDELSTGRTALNTIAALHGVVTRRHYVIAALVDVRTDQDRAALAHRATELGVTIDVVALATGHIDWPDDFAERAAAAVAGPPDGCVAQIGAARGELIEYPPLWPEAVREGGRHGFTPADVAAARRAAGVVADAVAPQCAERVLVLGVEEFMYVPALIALELAERLPGEVRISTTTRSPIFVIQEPGYPVRSVLEFPSSDSAADGPGPRFAYNVAAGLTDVVVVVDADAAGPELCAGLLEQLRTAAERVHVVVVPCHRPAPPPLRGPDFGTYAAAEVGWLLTDLSTVTLEAPIEEREEAVQSGGAHYAESLPVEYQPDAEYQALFEQVLDESAARVAHAVGVVTEIVLAERGPTAVLASLARAGTPVGILMRRWARYAHDLDLPHFAISIVRGRGIDRTALAYLAAHHDPADVVFVDGWTGKGAIARELHAAVAAVNSATGTAFSPELAVLADPGGCVTTFGTRADFLVPSACLNSTVSGLVSRTVLNQRLLRPGTYHGAKFYRELAGIDASRQFLDTVQSRFEAVHPAVDRDWPVRRTEDRTPTWAGWAEVEALTARYGLHDVTLVKPGVGETTRVLLRRVPWAVLVRPEARPGLTHVLMLAERRGVPVRDEPGLTFSCVGLIHPRYTRGATGADGVSVRP